MMGKLCSCVLYLFFAMKLRDSLVCAKMSSAVYTVPADGNPATYIRCGFSLMKKSQFAGGKVADSTGECVGLTLESIQNIKPESGHGLMYKNVVQEQTVHVSYWWCWRIHNLYGIISAIEVALTFPTGAWGGITLNLANEVKDGPSITYDRVPIHIKLIEDTTMALVDDWYNGSWATNFVTTYPKPSLTGVTSKIKLVVQDGSIKGLFDDEEWFVFSDRHHFEPKMIKQFFINVYAGGVALVHNVTLFGTCN